MEIEKILKSNGTSLSNWKKMPKPFRDVTDSQNVLILDELSYNREEFTEEHDRDILKMTDEQRKIYEEIMDAVIRKRGGVFFVYGFGGTGKTFLWRLLSAAIRSRGEIVLKVPQVVLLRFCYKEEGLRILDSVYQSILMSSLCVICHQGLMLLIWLKKPH